jgi:hypothetical protein
MSITSRNQAMEPFMKGLGCNLNGKVTDELPKSPLNWPKIQPLVIEVFSVKLA